MDVLNILCGASIFSKEVISKSEIIFNYVCDSNLGKIGSVFEGIEIIPYERIMELLKDNKLRIFLANRYVSGTVKKFEDYFENKKFKLYGFISDDLKNVTEIKNLTDYYNKGNIIKDTLLKVSFLAQCKDIINNKILIYTMRKVGTISIKYALDKSFGNNILYLHSLNVNSKEKEFINEVNLNNRSISAYYRKAALLVMDNIKSGNKLKIITAVREPVSRNLSFMFYNLQLFLGLNTNIVNPQNITCAYTEIFEDLYYQKINHNYFLNWYDIELKNSLGLDVYEYPFDKKKGYSIIEKDNIQILLLKIEALDTCTDIIKEFTGVENLKIEKENSSDINWYKPIYDKYKEEFIPNKEHLQELYNSKFMKHFYSDEEIRYFYKKWRKI